MRLTEHSAPHPPNLTPHVLKWEKDTIVKLNSNILRKLFNKAEWNTPNPLSTPQQTALAPTPQPGAAWSCRITPKQVVKFLQASTLQILKHHKQSFEIINREATRGNLTKIWLPHLVSTQKLLVFRVNNAGILVWNLTLPGDKAQAIQLPPSIEDRGPTPLPN